MNAQMINLLILAIAFLALFATGEGLFHFAGVPAEYTRKCIHLGTGLITLLFPVLLSNHWYVLLLCSLFALLLVLSLRFNFLRSINAIGRKSYGSLMYPAAVYGTFLAYDTGFTSYGEPGLQSYYIPILILAVCDPLAALVGRKYPWKPYTVGNSQKTLAGSMVFLVAAFFLCYSLLIAFAGGTDWRYLVIAAGIAVATTLTEAVARNGFDNLLIPAVAVLCLYIFSHHTTLFT